MFDTIVAIASGNINQAISIIRISGPDAFKIVIKIFTGKIGNNKTISFGNIIDQDGRILDEVLIGFFKGRNNFVGEDTIEINAHGGVLITNIILELIISLGARLATPGEFTRRAFLNGKINLIKAEAINDLIHAKTHMQTKIAAQKFNNQSAELILILIQKIEKIIGICEVNIDYPEYDDIEQVDQNKLINTLENIVIEISNIIKISEENQIFLNPQLIAIVGLPNVGKSSLMNALMNEDKSIITDIAGTTRDVVEGEIIFNNIVLKLKDTAGIRKSNDIIEKIGIEKAYQEIERASIVLHIIDANQSITEIDQKIEKKAKDKFYFKIFNKADLLSNEYKKKCQNQILISAKNQEISLLEEAFKKHFATTTIDSNFNLNNRQNALLKKARISLSQGLSALKENFGFEVVIVDIIESWESLKAIIGEVNKEDLLDSIFANFCLGK